MKRLISLLIGLAFVITLTPVTTASAASPAPIVGYQTAHLTSGMNRAINSIPCNPKYGNAKIILYSLNNDILRESVERKLRCGAKIWLMTSIQKPDGENEAKGVSPDIQKLINAFKKYKRPYKIGRGALAKSGNSSIEHQKLVLIDRGGSNKYVISDSGNWTFSTDRAYNDRFTMRDTCLYKGSSAHFDRLWKLGSNKTLKSDPIARSCDGKVRIYWFPTNRTDPTLNWAKSAKCGRGDRVIWSVFYMTSGSSTKYGSGKKLVDQLIRFKKAGADVRVAANDYKWSSSQRARLVKAKIPVYKSNVNQSVYMHRKALAASGCTGGPYGEQGSTTRNATAFGNGNQLVTVRYQSTVNTMIREFDKMTAGKKRFTK